MLLQALLLQGFNAGSGNLGVLSRLDSGHTDAANDFSFMDDGDTAFQRQAGKIEQLQVCSTFGEAILEVLCGPAVKHSRFRFALGDFHTAQLRVVQPLKKNEIAGIVNDRDRDRPVLPARFLFGGRHDLASLIECDRGPVGDRLLSAGEGCGEIADSGGDAGRGQFHEAGSLAAGTQKSLADARHFSN